MPRAFTPSLALPTAAAAALVFTTTGATVVSSVPPEAPTDRIDLALARSQVDEGQDDIEALAERRSETTDQTSLLQGRRQEAERVAREKVREALRKEREAEAAEERRKQWTFPAEAGRFTSGYGMRWGRMHNGIDFAGPIGTPIFAVSSGTVIKTVPAGSCGRQVYVEHWNDEVTRYCHMDSFAVSEGEPVAAGQQIGRMGNTGRSTGPHLHFEVYPNGINGATTNPSDWLRNKGV